MWLQIQKSLKTASLNQKFTGSIKKSAKKQQTETSKVARIQSKAAKLSTPHKYILLYLWKYPLKNLEKHLPFY